MLSFLLAAVTRLRAILVVTAACVAMAACGDVTAPASQPRVAVLPEWVTGDAARAVGPDGYFAFSDSAGPAEVASTTASRLAVAWALLYATSPNFANGRAYYDSLRGAPIDWRSLAPCRSNARIEGALGPLPDSLSGSNRRYHADQWLVSMCERSGAQSLFADVSTRATNVRVDSAGAIIDSSYFDQGSEVNLYPQVAVAPERFVSPELAVATAFAVAHKRVSKPPAAVRRATVSGGFGQLFVGAASRWSIVLEDTVLVTGQTSGRHLAVTRLFVRCDIAGRLITEIPMATQPATLNIYELTGDPSASQLSAIPVPVRTPIFFEEISRP